MPTEGRSRSRAQVFHTVEQERLPIATYEFEQTRLEWERMVINGDIALEQLKVDAVASSEVLVRTDAALF